MKTRWIAACLAAAVSISGLAFAAAPPANLNYRQKDAVKRIDMNTGEVDRGLDEIKQKQAEFDKAAEPSLIQKRELNDVTGRIKTLSNKLDNAERALKDLPPDHPETKARIEKIAAQRAALAKADEAVVNFGKNQGETGKKFDNVKADIAKVKAMAKAYENFQFTTDPARVGTLAARYKEDGVAATEMFKLYKPLINQQTPEGKEFNYWYQQLGPNFKGFIERSQAFLNDFHRSQDAAYADALKMAEKAAAEKKPAFFGGGVQQKMDEAKKSLEVFVALAGEKHEAAVAARAEFAEQEKKIAALKESLKADILASTKTPADVYKGPDKATLKALVEAEWKKLYPADQLLGVKFIQPEWKRKRGSDWSTAWKRWEDYDRSEMVVRVVVKNDEKISTLYFVYITKDHMSNDLITVGAKTKTANYVQEEMLTSNFEP